MNSQTMPNYHCLSIILKSLIELGMVMTLWFMTSNQGKVAEAQEHFSHLGIDVKQFEFEAVEPQTDSLEIVALSKIEQAINHLPNSDDMLLVEDAGLFIEALDGFPGVYSSYVLKTIGCAGIFKLLNHLVSEDLLVDAKIRRAEFRAVSVLYKDGITTVAEGVCPGRISHQIAEGNGFGFDPIFIPSDLDDEGNPVDLGEMGVTSTHGKTFGQISLEEKQLYSHRRRALTNLISNIGLQ